MNQPGVTRGRFLTTLLVVLFGVSLLSSPAASGTLEIHQVNVQQGDCTFIIGPDGTTLLIDAGKRSKGAEEVVPYLKDLGIQPADGLDFVICTHRDEDHLGGLDEVLNAGYDVRQAIWDNGSRKTDGGSRTDIADFLAAASRTAAGPVQAIPLKHVIELGDGATATCVAVGGEVIGYGPVIGAESENDLSVAILIQYGDFEYLTAGDLGGGDSDHSCTGRSTSQANVETPLAYALRLGESPFLGPDGLEVLDVNHHGSESSSNMDYMNLLSPAVAVINTGPGQGSNYHHPRIDVVEGVLMAQAGDCITVAPALVLQTEEGDPDGAGRSEAGFCIGDILIRTSGRGTFQIFGTGQVSQGSDERLAAGIPGAGRLFPLDGVRPPAASGIFISEIMYDPHSVRDTAGEWFEIFNPGSAPVDLNGWTIRDDDSDSHMIFHDGPLLVPPGEFMVLGRNGAPDQNGGYRPDYIYSGINLANGPDEIELVNPAGQVVDRVAYLAAPPWPSPVEGSIQLASPSTDNSLAENWISSPTRGGTFDSSAADKGTPGH